MFLKSIYSEKKNLQIHFFIFLAFNVSIQTCLHQPDYGALIHIFERELSSAYYRIFSLRHTIAAACRSLGQQHCQPAQNSANNSEKFVGKKIKGAENFDQTFAIKSGDAKIKELFCVSKFCQPN